LHSKVPADLVVLTGCDTALGKITGDGVIRLSRAFLVAGADSVISSLWAIDDMATAFLITEFYGILRKNTDKAGALRQAMLETMKKYPNPQDWASFTLVGYITRAQPKRSRSVLKGMAPYPLLGEDAQEWVSRTRREADKHRERLLRGEE
jgi:hypothetical protein